MKYFTIAECTRSETARSKGIDNTPGPEHLAHITESIETLVDPLREAWGAYCKSNGLGKEGIMVSSGYRGPALNTAVGGSNTSSHCHGYAFDLVPSNGKMLEFKRFCRSYLSDKPFDQLISEKEDGNGTPRWMHIGYKNRDGAQRRQFLSLTGKGYIPMTE